jgi:hypothetical protein
MNPEFLDVFSCNRGPQLGTDVPCPRRRAPEPTTILRQEFNEEEPCTNVLV